MRFRTLVLLILSPILTKAQYGQPLLDSLLKVLPGMKEDTNKVKVLMRVSGAYSRIDAKKGIAAGLQGAALARKLNWPPGTVSMMNSLGLCYTTTAEYDKALACFDTAYTLGEKKGYRQNMLLALMNDGVIYNDQGYYSRAVDYTMRSLKIAEEIRDSDNIALDLANIGSIYSKLLDYSKAQEYAQQAYAYYRRRGNRSMEAIVLAGLADIYDALGQRARSLETYSQALVLFRQLGDRAGLVVNLANRAITWSEDKNYVASIRDFSEAARLADSLGDSYRLASVLENFGHTYIDAAQAVSIELPDQRALYLEEAKKTLGQALAINQKNRNLDALIDNYKYIALLDSVRGNYKEALTAYQQYKFYSDSIFITGSQKTIQKLEDQRQIDVRDKQIEINRLDLKNQRNQRWYLIAGILVLLLIGGLLYRQSIIRKRTNTVLLQLNTELDQANEVKTQFFNILNHDLRAPVATLINLLRLQQEAPDLLEKDRREIHARRIFANAENLLLTMEDLLLWSKGQMKTFQPQVTSVAVEQLFADLRNYFSGVTNVRMTFDAAVPQLDTDEHYLKTIMRNLTSNAIKALAGTPDATISWKAWEKDGKHYLSITDNGPGIDEQQLKALYDESVTVGGTTGLGLHVVRELARAIGCRVSVSSLPDGGTEFLLALTD